MNRNQYTVVKLPACALWVIGIRKGVETHTLTDVYGTFSTELDAEKFARKLND